MAWTEGWFVLGKKEIARLGMPRQWVCAGRYTRDVTVFIEENETTAAYLIYAYQVIAE